MRDGADTTYECDALVVGSGAAGMSAAVTAGHSGLNVLIAEIMVISATARLAHGDSRAESVH